MNIISLSSGNLVCKITPEMGGSVYSFDYATKDTTQPLMRHTASEDCHLIIDYASWPLVPFSNRINKGKFSFGGKDYRVPVTWLGPPHHASHGHGWERPWTVTHQDSTHCDMVFSFNDKDIWPFPYKAEQNFALDENGLNIRLSVTNTGTEDMPTGLGLHPYFPRTTGTTLKANVGHLWEIDEHTIPVHRIPVPPEYDFSTPKTLDKAKLDHCFDGYGGIAEIEWPNRPFKLRITSSDNLRHFVVYTPEGQDFFCAEPVSHRPDAINHMDEADNGLIVLRPGETVVASYRFEAIPA